MNKKILFTTILLLGFFAITTIFIITRSQSSNDFTQDDAITSIIALHPELENYKIKSLPLNFIDTKLQIDGWSVVFAQRESDMSNILQAQCYHVNQKGVVIATGQYIQNNQVKVGSIKIEDCTPNDVLVPQINVLPYGNVTLKIGSIAQFKDISIKPVAIEEDSRCPSDVQCFWAGIVRVKIQVVSTAGISTNLITSNQVLAIDKKRIILRSVVPEKRSDSQIDIDNYRLTFNVLP